MVRLWSIFMTLNNELIKMLRCMHSDAATVAQLLEKIKTAHNEEPQIKMYAMKYLREAFRLSMVDVTSIGGWSGFDGELSDEEINSLIKIPL